MREYFRGFVSVCVHACVWYYVRARGCTCMSVCYCVCENVCCMCVYGFVCVYGFLFLRLRLCAYI